MDKVTKSVNKRQPPSKGGSRKGVPNKNTKAIKDMILEALGEAGGVNYLVRRANDPRTASAFLGLVGKVLPTQVTGADGGAIQTVTRVEIVALTNDNGSGSDPA